MDQENIGKKSISKNRVSSIDKKTRKEKKAFESSFVNASEECC